MHKATEKVSFILSPWSNLSFQPTASRRLNSGRWASLHPTVPAPQVPAQDRGSRDMPVPDSSASSCRCYGCRPIRRRHGAGSCRGSSTTVSCMRCRARHTRRFSSVSPRNPGVQAGEERSAADRLHLQESPDFRRGSMSWHGPPDRGGGQDDGAAGGGVWVGLRIFFEPTCEIFRLRGGDNFPAIQIVEFNVDL